MAKSLLESLLKDCNALHEDEFNLTAGDKIEVTDDSQENEVIEPVIDTDLEDGSTPSSYLDKNVIFCNICLKPFFSDTDVQEDTVCPTCSASSEDLVLVGKVVKPETTDNEEGENKSSGVGLPESYTADGPIPVNSNGDGMVIVSLNKGLNYLRWNIGSKEYEGDGDDYEVKASFVSRGLNDSKFNRYYNMTDEEARKRGIAAVMFFHKEDDIYVEDDFIMFNDNIDEAYVMSEVEALFPKGAFNESYKKSVNGFRAESINESINSKLYHYSNTKYNIGDEITKSAKLSPEIIRAYKNEIGLDADKLVYMLDHKDEDYADIYKYCYEVSVPSTRKAKMDYSPIICQDYLDRVNKKFDANKVAENFAKLYNGIKDSDILSLLGLSDSDKEEFIADKGVKVVAVEETNANEDEDVNEAVNKKSNKKVNEDVTVTVNTDASNVNVDTSDANVAVNADSKTEVPTKSEEDEEDYEDKESDISDFEYEEESFNKIFTKFLTDNYSNVKSFNLIEAKMNNNVLTLEGVITYNEGSTRNVTIKTDEMNLSEGVSKVKAACPLFGKSKAFVLEHKLENNKLEATKMLYRYKTRFNNESYNVVGKVVLE